MTYGVANRTGQPTVDEIRRLLGLAFNADIRTIDTARGYGSSEEIIGELVGANPAWTVMTKLSADLPLQGAATADIVQLVRRSLEESHRALRRDCLDVVLLHRPAHRSLGDGAVWRELLAQRDAGHVNKLGVSVVSPHEAEALLGDPDVSVVQAPCNLLDQRLVRSGLLSRLQAAGKTVVIRSIFLQGTAHLGWAGLPPWLRTHAAELREPLSRIESWCTARSLALADPFLVFGLGLRGTVVLIGCETAGQIAAALRTCQTAGPLLGSVTCLASEIPDLPEQALNPAFWPKA
jgi:aryl-alcohol dehydrogenase-like predicted oxidoreductase